MIQSINREKNSLYIGLTLLILSQIFFIAGSLLVNFLIILSIILYFWLSKWDNNLKFLKEYKKIIIEEFIPGRELTISVLGDLICDPIEIEAQEEFYNFEAKYNRTDTSYSFPVFAKDKLAKLKKLSKNAFDLLGCDKWGRVDLIEYEDKFYFIEVNTVPGMTETSLVPKSAEKEGLNFFELIKKIIIDSIDN